jgi:hypothetical protein
MKRFGLSAEWSDEELGKINFMNFVVPFHLVLLMAINARGVVRGPIKLAQ